MRHELYPNEWVPEHVWRQVKHSIAIPCVDIILENLNREILLGWRKIPPYSYVWATPGGRVLRGENLQDAANRILREYGVNADDLFLVGVFPIKFKTRADFTVCVASSKPSGVAIADGHEFSSFKWTSKLPSRTGANYVKMIRRWRLLRGNRPALWFNKIY